MINVTAGVIQDINGRILIAKRNKNKHLGGSWEFVGGKVENEESFEECLLREVQEELGIKIEIEKYLGSFPHDYEEFSINLHAFLARYHEGQIFLKDHEEFKWVRIIELNKYDFAPADLPIINKMQNEI